MENEPHREITIYDIAEQLNISAATVSRGLNNSPLVSKRTRDKIHKIAKEMGYRPNAIASNLRRQRSKTIGILLHELHSNFVVSVLAGIEKITTSEQYDLLITHSNEEYLREIANTKNLLNKRIDGLMVSLSLDTKNIDHFMPFFERNIPVVFFDRVPGESPCIKVVIDNLKCGYDATEHLIKQGCKRIAHITADLNRNVYNDRFEGYKNALKKHRLAFDKDLVEICDLGKDATRNAVKKLLKQKPDAFFITNDFAAAVCIEMLGQQGIKVPQDIAVFGFNNDAICELITPKLSTIDYPGVTMGELAAQELIMQIKLQDAHKNAPIKTILVPTSTIIRSSSLKSGR